MTAGAVIVAAGKSERMGGQDKLLQPLAGHPLISYSIAVFAAFPDLGGLVIVASEANYDQISSITAQLAPEARVTLGGPKRQDSVRAGIDALPAFEYIVVHDAARPMVTRELVQTALDGAAENGAALCAVPATDTLKRADASGLVRGTVSRQDLWLAQTPQAFRRSLLLRAHEEIAQDATDDAAMVELLGEPIRLVSGSSRNLKVTTDDDLALVEALLQGERRE